MDKKEFLDLLRNILDDWETDLSEVDNIHPEAMNQLRLQLHHLRLVTRVCTVCGMELVTPRMLCVAEKCPGWMEEWSMVKQMDYCERHGVPLFCQPDGVCLSCGRKIKDTDEKHITGCPYCHRTYCD